MEKQNFIILISNPRSGSTTLSRILDLHSKINIFGEPFNKGLWGRKSFNFDNFKHDLKEYNGIKTHFWHLTREQNKKMLLDKNARIIFLRRKNKLKQGISYYISKKLNIWNVNDKINKKEIDNIIKKNALEIDVNDLEKLIKQFTYYENYFKSLFNSKRCKYFEINYEEIFSEKTKIKEKIEKINAIFNFLNLNKINDLNKTKKMKDLLNYKKRKINNSKTYYIIKNIYEIEERLGSQETGYIFRRNKQLNLRYKLFKKRMRNIQKKQKLYL